MATFLRRLSAVAVFLWLTGVVPAGADAPRVVASIPPVHSLTAGVMQGIGSPQLLVRGAGSPHDYALRPSDAEALNTADIVIRVGDELEGFLAKPVTALPAATRVVTLSRLPGIRRLDAREGGVWETHRHERGNHRDGHDEAGHRIDPHLWLDPVNATVIVDALAAALATADPANAARYDANAEEMKRKLKILQADIGATVAPVRAVPFLVFHDAYQYFEARFDIPAAGAIALSDAARPSAARVAEIRQAVAGLGARCVFAEPQFEPRVVATVIEGTEARAATLDPLGAALPPGPGLYPALIETLAADLADCLASGG